ncbi:MAG: transcriptional repressor [Deltaproteobacteria bacterium]|nr:transcriptional repressor [Deltaproteobacteria bacterium]
MQTRAERFAVFRRALKEKGLKSTAQRDDIARAFFASHRHMSIDDLYREVRKVNPRVGYATVYRTIKLLKECELADEQHFADGQTRYENADREEEHHDHVICDRCGRIVEFSDDSLEQLQEEIAARLGFVLAHHRLELYGICRECREGRGAPAPTDRMGRVRP